MHRYAFSIPHGEPALCHFLNAKQRKVSLRFLFFFGGLFRELCGSFSNLEKNHIRIEGCNGRKTQNKTPFTLLLLWQIYDETGSKAARLFGDIPRTGLMLLSDEPYPVPEDRALQTGVTDDIGQHPYINFKSQEHFGANRILDPSHFDTGFEIEEIQAKRTRN